MRSGVCVDCRRIENFSIDYFVWFVYFFGSQIGNNYFLVDTEREVEVVIMDVYCSLFLELLFARGAVGMEVVAPESPCLARLEKAEWNASELRFR